MDLFHPFRDHRRKGLVEKPFSSEWARIIDANVPYCRMLDASERIRLWDLIKVFIAEKNFEGCGGVVVSEEIKLTIAAQACLLLINLRHNYFEKLVSILVYPRGFTFEREEHGEFGMVTEEQIPVSGLSTSIGSIALSWPDTASGARDPDDGVNVVLHEFAHQLDLLDCAMDGAPVLTTRAMYGEWAAVLGAEFERLRSEVAHGIPSIISSYGATKPAEFFAVVTELFFEKPCELQREHPALYEEFRQYYGQDPAARFNCNPADIASAKQ